jgi:4-hydroxybenzoate polyprenyltransferase
MQLVFRYGFLKLQEIPLALANWQYGLLVLATVLIAAGGYVINDIFDQETDEENKPEKRYIGTYISESMGYNIYVGLTLAGVGIGYYLSYFVILRPNFVVFFILIASLLYFYASKLKKMLLLGNIAVAFTLAFSVIIIGIFDIFPATDDTDRSIMTVMFSIIVDYAIFAFLINLIREIVKDVEDINGDLYQEMNTLPIAIGTKRTNIVVFVLLIISIILCLLYINNHLMDFNLYYATIYALLLIIAPLIYCCIRIFSAAEKSDYHFISTILKWIIFFGILSISVISLNIKYNA